jgi:biopolymer transport protein TolR
MLGLGRARSHQPIAEVNVVPFIDVMLILLVIFMITAPLLTQGVKIELPQTRAKSLPTPQQDPLIVTVDAAGNLYFNLADKPDQPITLRTLSYLVTHQLSHQLSDEQRPVLVRGDKSVYYGKVVEVMVLLQQAGAKQVGLMTQSPPSFVRIAS